MKRKKVAARPIKDLRKAGRKGPEKTEKQIEASRMSGLKRTLGNANPMKNPASRNKFSKKMKGRITNPNYLFKKGNKFGVGQKTNLNQIEARRNTGRKNIGRKQSQKQKDSARLLCTQKNPMKNPEIVQRQQEHPNTINSLIKKGEHRGKEFKNGNVPWSKGKKLNIDQDKMHRANEARRIATLSNPNIKKHWFKKGHERYNKKDKKEVQNEKDNIVITPFNPATLNN